MTVDIASLVSDNLDIWTTAVERKSGAGRGGGKRVSLYGIGRLRALILDLAVRGKLVGQDDSDEPASKLIQKISQSAAAKSSKRDAAQSEVGPFLLPDSWAWVKLGSICDLPYGKNLPTKCLLDHGYPVFGANGVIGRFSEFHYSEPKLLISCRGAYSGKPNISPPECYITNNSIICDFYRDDLTNLRCYYYFLSGMNKSSMVSGSAQPQVTVANAAPFLIPLPPFAEQQRIVAKVDELMALCDALEAESAAAMAAHQALVEALLATLSASTDAADLATNWARLEAHFDTLFTTESSVNALKQTVLELAVRGKLVPQVATDEPAAAMLKAVKKSGVDRGAKQKPHSTIADADHPFNLPKGWCWERFDNLIEPKFPIAYGVLVPGADQPDGIPFVRIADLSITDPAPLPEKSISAEVDAQFPRTRLRGGEILMGVVGSIGKLGVAPASWAGANIARAICRIVPSPLMDRSYVLWLLQSDFMQSSFTGDTRTLAQPTLNIGLIRLAATPVPPAAEQKRIVAKVDELMALCDALNASITDAASTQKYLTDAITERSVA